MTVQQLIDELKRFNPEMNVVTEHPNYDDTDYDGEIEGEIEKVRLCYLGYNVVIEISH